MQSGGVWPGYVAAVAGLVQSLMLVSATVATVVYLMGMLGQSKHRAADQSDATAERPVQTQTMAQAKKNDKSIKEGTKETEPEPKVKKEAWASAAEYEGKDGLRSLAVVFPADQVKLDTHTDQQVKQVLEQLKTSGASRWRVIGHEKSDEALSARKAFFRVQTLRSALLASGIKADRIEQRILPADDKHHPDTQVVVVPLADLPSSAFKGP
jgi:outer membrane protein OmpA-like peptidoglycan-associated protein